MKLPQAAFQGTLALAAMGRQGTRSVAARLPNDISTSADSTGEPAAGASELATGQDRETTH